MALPSLFSLSLLPLSTQQILEICQSGQFPSCAGIWKRKAELDFDFWEPFFDLYLGSETSSRRMISEYFRYLELGSINYFLPQAAASHDTNTGKISGLWESFIGVKEAILTGDDEKFNFFISRLKPETLKELKNYWMSIAERIGDLFPQGPDLISISLFDRLLQEVGEKSIDDINSTEKASAAQRWIKNSRFPEFLPLWVLIRDQKAFSGDIPQEELFENWDRYSPKVLLKLIERGNQEALNKVLSFFEEGRFGFKAEEILLSVLKSGRSVIQEFEPFLQYVKFYRNNIDLHFEAAVFGGNWENVELISRLSETNISLPMSTYISSVCKGFFFHRDVVSSCNMIDKIPGYTWFDVSGLDYSSLPIDIIDLIYHKTSFVNASSVSFFSLVLQYNLGYLDIVQFCLDELERRRSEPNFVENLTPHQLNYYLEAYEKLTPLSVSLVRSAMQSWGIVRITSESSDLPLLVEDEWTSNI
nr:hypothetical protein pmam_302 [Pithovirus mammoth]